MKRALLAVVSTVAALVLLLSFKTHPLDAGAAPPAAIGPVSPGAATGESQSAGESSASAANSDASSGASTPATTAKSYTGNAVQTPYGPVEVKITVRSGKIVGVTAVEYPTTDPRDAQINAYAIPALDSEATVAQSAKIDVVSGATYTSEGYISSLQSALDKAAI